MSTTVAVIGGRGKTGRAVAAAVTAAGGGVRVIGRAEWAGLANHLRGCQSLYLIAPNMHPDEADYVSAVIDAAEQVGVDRLVYHSVAAPYEPALPHHLGKAEAEVAVRRSGLRWTILQPAVYLQNFRPMLVGPDPLLSVPYDPARGFTFVDLTDVAEVAATVLGDDRFIGATLEIGGTGIMSVAELTTQASAALGRQVRLEQITVAQWRAGPGRGLPERERQWLEAMFEYYDRHGLVCGTLATKAILGRDPTNVSEATARMKLSASASTARDAQEDCAREAVI